MIDSLLARFRVLPRAARWGVFFVLFCAAYFVVVEPVMSRTRLISERADRLQASLSRLAELESADSGSGRDIAGALSSFGAPFLPSDPAARPEAVYSAVNEILDRHDIADRSITERQSPMREDDARVIMGSAAPSAAPGAAGGAAVIRLILDISFEASPEVVAAVLADLESSPHITAVSRLKVEKVGASSGGGRAAARPGTSGRVLRANIVPEAWVSSAARPRPATPPPPASPALVPEPSPAP